MDLSHHSFTCHQLRRSFFVFGAQPPTPSINLPRLYIQSGSDIFFWRDVSNAGWATERGASATAIYSACSSLIPQSSAVM
jgi:hypothetical protein